MQFDHVIGGNPGRLVQIVDVLGDDARHLAGPVKTGDGAVAAAGLGAAELILHGKAAPPALVPHLRVGQEVAEFDRPHLGPDAAGRPEVGDAALGGNAGAGEGDHHLGGLDHVPQTADAGFKIGRDHMIVSSYSPSVTGGGPSMIMLNSELGWET